MNRNSLVAPVVLCLAAGIPCAAAKVVIKNKSSRVVYVVVDATQKASMKKGNGPMTPVDKDRSTITLFANEETTLETTSRSMMGNTWLTIQKGEQSTQINYLRSKWEAKFGGTAPVQISAKGDVVEVN